MIAYEELKARVLEVARSLRTDDDLNPEYDRALVEMTADLLGCDRETAIELVLGDR